MPRFAVITFSPVGIGSAVLLVLRRALDSITFFVLVFENSNGM